MIPSSLLTESFTIKKSDQATDTSGKITHILSTVSTGNKGRFDPSGGSRNRDFMGSVKQASMVLYCNYNSDVQFGRIIQKEDDSTQYDILRVDTHSIGTKHHMEVYLEQRRIAIV